MASSISRRLTTKILRNPRFLFSQSTPHHLSTISHSNTTPLNPNFPFPTFLKPRSNPIPTLLRPFSTIPEPPQGDGKPQPGAAQEFRHQEIVGPTVERDISALANETRDVLTSLRKTLYDLSLSFAVLGGAQLVLGAWIVYAVKPPPLVAVQSVAAFSFPFTLAFLIRRTMKPIGFFQKMEEQGRLQILTLTLQASKNLNLMLRRMRVMALLCVFGVPVGALLCLR